jgi:L-alanine-DL-glutamate epimerase-like enolase superfamily enzyme
MKIASIEFFPLTLGTPGDAGTDASAEDQASFTPEMLAARRYAPPETAFVRITTEDGFEGYGDGATLPHYLGHGIGSMIDWLGRFRTVLVGEDPLNIAGIHHRMERVASIGVPGCRPAQAAIDMAIYDLAGKVHGCPVYELLGGSYRQELELQTQMHGHTVDQLLGVCNHYIERGFTGLKLKIGSQLRQHGYSKPLFDADADKVAGVMARLPHHIQVDVDANQGIMNAKMAIAMFERVRRDAFHPNMAIEQPLHHLDLQGHAQIRRALPFPVVLDEAVTSPTAMIQIIRMDAADRIVLKPNRVGGLWPARRIVDICEANGIGVSLDTMPFTLLGDTMLCHLGATIKHHFPLDAQGHTFFAGTPFSGGVRIGNGRAHLGNAPGFGVEFDPGRLAAA